MSALPRGRRSGALWTCLLLTGFVLVASGAPASADSVTVSTEPPGNAVVLGAAVWVGGLVALVALTVVRLPARQRTLFWPRAIRRFSTAATVSVGAMILTGLWTTWIHLGSPTLLVTTIYGQRLLVKLILVACLIGLGSFNLFWVLPRVEAIRRAGHGQSRLSVVMQHFRRAIAAEAILGVAILLVVPFLSGSARNQAFQGKAADLTQTRQSGGLVVRLKPSGLQTGFADYDVWLLKAQATRVSLGFASPKLGVPETDVVATALGADHYRVTGLYTPMVGAWQVRVSAAGASGRPKPTEAVFGLHVLGSAPQLPRAPAPEVHTSTWAWGFTAVIAVIAALLGASGISRRLSDRRARAATARGGTGLSIS